MLTVPRSIHVCNRVRVASRFARCLRSTRSSRRPVSPRSVRILRIDMCRRLLSAWSSVIGLSILLTYVCASSIRIHPCSRLCDRARAPGIGQLIASAASRGPFARWLQSAFFLERDVQPLRQPTECERRTAKRRVLFLQASEFLATMRAVISHKQGPLRSSRTFEFDDVHTGHNERNRRTVHFRAVPGAPPRPVLAGNDVL